MSTNNYLESFDKDTTKAWRARVERELKGKSFEDFLIWKSMEGFEIDSWQNKRPNNLNIFLIDKIDINLWLGQDNYLKYVGEEII